mgnify:CR=1 FL=1
MMTVGSHVVAMIMVGVGGGDYDDDDGGGCGGDDDDDDDDVDLCWEKKIPLPPPPSLPELPPLEQYATKQ